MQKPSRGAAAAREFGDRVRSTREALGLSQERLGERAELHRTYIGHCERGEVNPSLYNIIRLAAALELDPAELVSGLRPDRGFRGGRDGRSGGAR